MHVHLLVYSCCCVAESCLGLPQKTSAGSRILGNFSKIMVCLDEC